jgi:FkbM family methyltransferase
MVQLSDREVRASETGGATEVFADKARRSADDRVRTGSGSRAALGIGVAVLCGLVGRRAVVRASRFVLNHARLDLVNSPATNGEYALQNWVLGQATAGEAVTALDVGANVGSWSRMLLSRAGPTRVHLHAFEPAADAYRALVDELPATVRVNRVAVSDRCGQATLHLVGPTAGTNSLHAAEPGLPTQPILTVTIDTYLSDHAIERVDLLKVDTEGHDYAVLRGAAATFAAGAIGVVQFEYNHRWIHARRYLKDVFDLLGPYGYHVGKLTPSGIEWYPAWDHELETFIEANYVGCTAAWARRLPAVAWWKQPGQSSTTPAQRAVSSHQTS